MRKEKPNRWLKLWRMATIVLLPMISGCSGKDAKQKQDAVPESEQTNFPLLNAVLRSDTQGVARLICSGARVDARSSVAFSWTPLIAAAAQSHPDVVSQLLKAGANPNTVDMDGLTPLAWAARREDCQESTTVVRILLAAGADKNQRLGDGMTTALDFAKARAEPCPEVLRLLSNKPSLTRQR